jgi:hypothetical protein
MTKARLGGFGFFFGGFQHGPSSGELLGMIDDLLAANLVAAESGAIVLTREGNAVADELLGDGRVWSTKGNQAVLAAIDATLAELGDLPLDELLRHIYAITVAIPDSKPIAVADAKAHFERTGKPKALLGKMEPAYYKADFTLPPDWERTLLVLGNPEVNPLRSAAGGAPVSR